MKKPNKMRERDSKLNLALDSEGTMIYTKRMRSKRGMHIISYGDFNQLNHYLFHWIQDLIPIQARLFLLRNQLNITPKNGYCRETKLINIENFCNLN